MLVSFSASVPEARLTRLAQCRYLANCQQTWTCCLINSYRHRLCSPTILPSTMLPPVFFTLLALFRQKSFRIKVEPPLSHESPFHPLCLIRDKSTRVTNTPRLNSSKAKPRFGCRILACYSYEIIKTFRFLVRNSVSLLIVA